MLPLPKLATAAGSGVVAALCLSAPSSQAGRLWDNCTTYNVKYPHWMGERYAVDQTSGTPVTTFLRSDKKYKKAMRINPDLDRDGDKTACEKA